MTAPDHFDEDPTTFSDPEHLVRILVLNRMPDNVGADPYTISNQDNVGADPYTI